MQHLLLALLLLPAFTQETDAPRRTARTIGKVVAANGKGIVGARVFFVSWPLRNNALGAPDRIELATGKDGRFEARLLDGRAYTAWAQIDDGQGIAMTDVIEPTMAGQPLRLVQTSRWPRIRLKVSGRELWPNANFELRVRSSTRNVVEAPLHLDQEGFAELPVLPGPRGTVTVRTKEGLHVLVRSVDLGTGRTLELQLAKPIEVQLLVTSKSTGKPLEKAWAAQLPGMLSLGGFLPSTPFITLGVTDDTGRCRLQMPQMMDITGDKQPRRQFLLVGAPGHAATYVLMDSSDTAKDDCDIDVALDVGSTLRGRIVRANGEPAAGAQLLLATHVCAVGHLRLHAGVPPIPLTSDEDGRFEFHGLRRGESFHVIALADSLGRSTRGSGPVDWLVAHAGAMEATTDLGDIQLGRLSHVTIQVRRADGLPAAAARIKHQDRKLSSWIEYVADRRGEVAMLCPTGPRAFGAFEVEGGVSLATWELESGKTTRVWELSRPVPVSGKVLSKEGNPVPGAWVRLWNRPELPNRTVQDLCFEQQRFEVLTDEEGAFRIHTAGVPGTYKLYAGLRSDRGSTVSKVISFEVPSTYRPVPGVEISLPVRSPRDPIKK